ncbi:hypothetical protein BH11ACT7_BH11ACT7_04430 [soil metagenome]
MPVYDGSCALQQSLARRVAHLAATRFTLFLVSRRLFQDSQWVAYLALALAFGAVVLGVWGVFRTGEWHMPSTGAFKDFTAGIGSIVTALAVTVGGGWAYFRFVLDRTYKLRLAVQILGQWLDDGDRCLFHVRVRVTNIGGTRVALNQFGSGLTVSFPSSNQESPPLVGWEPVLLVEENDKGEVVPVVINGASVPRVFVVLEENVWIETGETIADDFLLDVDRPATISKLELSLIWNESGDGLDQFNSTDIEVFARRIIPASVPMIDTVESAG